VTGRRYVISGRVQGVGFRFFAVRAARERNLTGWVRNLPDGRVEAEAHGDEAALDALREELSRGPRGAAVRGVEETQVPFSSAIPDFDVKF
jgi:acylphosphatase